MTRYYRNYTEEEITEHVKNSKSLADVLRKIGLKPVGGNYITIRRILQKLNIDTSHFTGKVWNKGKVLKEIGTYIKPKHKKEALIRLRKKIRHCEHCKLIRWLGKKFP